MDNQELKISHESNPLYGPYKLIQDNPRKFKYSKFDIVKNGKVYHI